MNARHPAQGPVRRLAAAAALVAAVTLASTLAGCSSSQTPDQESTQSSTDADQSQSSAAAEDARTLIDRLEATKLADRRSDLMASVRPNELILTDADGNETSLPMPADQFYLSFAPYENQTHECYFHSLTTCTGELQNRPLEVTITDSETGQELVSDILTTNDNGFIGVWLPRGILVTLEVKEDGKGGRAEISTIGDDALTCLTTLRLS